MLRLLITAFALIAAAPLPVAKPTENPEEAQLLGYGVTMVSEGRAEDALAHYFDPIISRYEKHFASTKDRIYAARTTQETLFYALDAATRKQNAVVLGPTWAQAYYYRAYALVEIARSADARPALDKALAMSPENSNYLSELGQHYQNAKDWTKALEIYLHATEAALTYSPEDTKNAELSRAMRGQGYVLTELGRLDESEAMYRKCLQLDPGDKGAQRELKYIAQQRAKSKSL